MGSANGRIVDILFSSRIVEMNLVRTPQGKMMPAMLYGTAWKKEHTFNWVREALRQGFRAFDTACQPKHYNESGVGDAIDEALQTGDIKDREDVFLQTKFTPLSGQDLENVPYDFNASLETQVRQSVKTSLMNLKTLYIDSLILHSPLESHEETMRVWRVFEDLVESAQVKQIGISNIYNVRALELLWRDSRVKPSVVQNRFYKVTNYDRDIREFTNQHSIVYQSFWTLGANRDIVDGMLVSEISRCLFKTREQVFFRFLIQSNVYPLTGTRDKMHMVDDLECFNFKLDKRQMESLTELVFGNEKE